MELVAEFIELRAARDKLPLACKWAECHYALRGNGSHSRRGMSGAHERGCDIAPGAEQAER